MSDQDDVDVPDLLPVATFTLEEAVICLDLSRDGAYVAAGSVEDEIVVLDDKLGLVCKLAGHEGGSNSLAFAAGARLVSAGEDGKAKIWDAKSGACTAELHCEGVDADK